MIDPILDKRRTSSITVDLPASPISPVTAPQPSIIDSIEVEIATTASGLLQWPQGLPSIDGLIICYDRSNKSSFEPIEMLLSKRKIVINTLLLYSLDYTESYRSTNLPIMVLGCKSDLRPEVESNNSLSMLKKYDTGLIEVSNQSEEGKEKMRQSFHYMFKAVARQRGTVSFSLYMYFSVNTTIASKKRDDARNPAAPPPLRLDGTPWADFEKNDTPSSLPSIPPTNGISSAFENTNIPQIINPSVSGSIAQPPVWSQSSNDNTVGPQMPVDSNQLSVATSEDTHVESVELAPARIEEVTKPVTVEQKPVKEP